MTDERKKELATFKRRYGHHFIGVLVLLCFIGIGYLGWRDMNPKEPSMEETMGFDSLDVSYDIKIDGLDGDKYYYNIYFDHNTSDKELEDVDRCVDAIEKLNCNGHYHGCLSKATRNADDMAVMVMLNLWDAEDDSFINSFLLALDIVDGIEKVVINEDLTKTQEEVPEFDINKLNTECELEYKNYGDKTIEIYILFDHAPDHEEYNALGISIYSYTKFQKENQGKFIGHDVNDIMHHYAYDISDTTDYSLLNNVIETVGKNNNVKKIIVQTGADYEAEEFDADAPENYARKRHYIIKDKDGNVIYDSRKAEMDVFGFSFMELSFEAALDGFDGENFHYNIHFDQDVTKEDIAEIEKRLNAECSKYSEEDNIGYVSQAEIADERLVTVMLDLGNADTEVMITGIVQALNGMDGIEKVVINEGMDEFDM